MSLAAQDERLTRRVGAIALVVLAAGAAFAVFVAPRLEWGPRVEVEVYFHHTGGLREGAPVIAGGRTVGRIDAIARSPHGAPGPLRGDEGVVVTASIAARYAARLAATSDAFIASRGAFSERYLELGPPRPAAAAPAAAAPDPGPLSAGAELLGADPPTLDRVLERTWRNLGIASDFAAAIRPETDALRRELSGLGATLVELLPDGLAGGGVLGELAALRAEAMRLRDVGLGGDRGLAQLDAVLAAAQALVARARSIAAALTPPATVVAANVGSARARLAGAPLARIDAALTGIRGAIAKIDPLVAKLRDVRTRFERGEGTILRLMRDPEFPEDTKELGKLIKRQPWKVIDRPKD